MPPVQCHEPPSIVLQALYQIYSLESICHFHYIIIKDLPRPCSNSSIESVMPSNHLVLCRPLLLLHSIFLSIRIFSSELALHISWPEYWSFSFSISPSNEYSRLISFRINWFDLLTVQETLKSLLQYHSGP